ncbi:MAG: transketolase C-terminal domain-containing protein [Candidatus Binatia bacterium]
MTEALYFVPVPEFERVRKLNTGKFERAALFADLCRLNTLSMIAYAGSGHIGSSFSSLDIVTWLFLNEMKPQAVGANGGGDLYFSSKGHDAPGLYAAMIACGQLPADGLRKLRRLGGLPGHPDVGTPHIAANTGSLGMGISKAKGMLVADRLLGRERRIFVMTGDGELQEGQIWESLVSAANRRLGQITVIVDHNKLQSDIRVSETSDLGDLEAKFSAFGWHVARCDGHDLAALSDTLDRNRSISDRPKVIIADTVKGKGVSFMESSMLRPGELYRYHSGAPSPEDYARAADELIVRANRALDVAGAEPLRLEKDVRPTHAAPRAPERLIAAYSEALVAQAERNERIVALDGDLVLDTGLIPFRDRFPHRFIECGIAEQDMVSQAGGMALQGLLPVVHSFACFLAARPTEQIYNNASERTKVIYVGSLAGAVPGGPGHSHQAVNDIAMLGAIPGLELVEPSCAAEVGPLLNYLLNQSQGSGYLRLVSIPCEIPYSLPQDYRPVPGRGVELRPGKDAVIIGYGPVLLPQAWRAAEMLRERDGLDLAVVNLPWLSHIDRDWLRRTIGDRRAVFTLDNHLVDGGQGRMIAAAIAELNLDRSPLVRCFGLTDFPLCGQNDEVLRTHGLNAASLAQSIVRAADA